MCVCVCVPAPSETDGSIHTSLDLLDLHLDLLDLHHQSDSYVPSPLSSVKQNLLVLLADLFYLFEISPAKCVRQPGAAKERVLDVSSTGST